MFNFHANNVTSKIDVQTQRGDVNTTMSKENLSVGKHLQNYLEHITCTLSFEKLPCKIMLLCSTEFLNISKYFNTCTLQIYSMKFITCKSVCCVHNFIFH